MKILKTFENFSQEDIYEKTKSLIMEYPGVLDKVEPGQISIIDGDVEGYITFIDYDDITDKVLVHYDIDEEDEENEEGFITVERDAELEDLFENDVESIYDYIKSKI